MALATPKKFAMQQVFEILLRRPLDKSIYAYLTDCKTTSLENSVEMVYPTGGRGNVYIGTGFAHSRRATFTVEVATFNTEVMAIQNGTEIVTDSHEITNYEMIEATGTIEKPVFKTSKKAIGTTSSGESNGDEINFVYILNNDGTYGETYTQVKDNPTGNQFTYNAETQTLTFAEDSSPLYEDKIACAYTFKTADTAQKITLSVGATPPTVLVTAYGIARDVCTGELFPCVLEGQAEVDGDWSFDLSADGDTVVQNFSMEFVKPCLTEKLYDFVIYTDEE
jgi:hypothetical protein